MKKILLLEDDPILTETLVELLESENFQVTHASDGEQALDATFNQRFDLMLLDVNVPLLSGFEMLKELRESDDKTPAIFLTALTDIASLSQGFDIGADDYIKKPFDYDELSVRIHALLRKSYESYSNEITIDDFTFKIDTHELYKSKEFIHLSSIESTLCNLFFKNIDKILSKDEIFHSLDREISDGSLRVHITKLRKVGLNITSIKGIGYRLASS